ncbi:hypothetical protein [Leifsonia poae]|uniref:Uncharacterized protein n=1 Tax=Leifsonia poae TaxID=110933 RepID=A0A9W6LY76_9MICO|nr:hypothetical protein [Leifsonia poae]GLJ74550.1 hypothetical protein GCM10017584_01230 [Leifsonia poae]
MSTVIGVIVCFALFLGGLLLFGIATTLPAWQAAVFFAGIVCVALSIAIPVHVLPKFD